MTRLNKGVLNKALFGGLLALSASGAYSGAMGPEATAPCAKTYLGIFGGGGAVTDTDMTQYGTAFFLEATVPAGPLAVNAFGHSGSTSVGMVGGHVGMAWPNSLGSRFPITPAVELEGYYIGGADHNALVSNDTSSRLSEHDFALTYGANTGVFLVNAVLNANNSMFQKFRPYVGVGIGSAVISISDAFSLQVNPLEAGVNHFSTTDDKAATFAAQPKIGFRYDVNPNLNIFAEYRFLYIAPSNFIFGSTIAPGHAATSAWHLDIPSQIYNMGTVGIDFDL